MPAEATNDNLEDALEDLRHQGAGFRDELFERLADRSTSRVRTLDRPTGGR